MSYTNKTPNYDLPQYTADDKPTYLGDFNKAMLDIDTAMKNNENLASSANSNSENASTTAQEALTSATQASKDASEAKASIAQVSTIANNAQTTATNAQTTASSANTTATNAQSLAETANSTAQTANSTSDAVQSSLQTLSNDISNWYFNNNIANSSFSNSNITMCYNKTLGLLQLYGYINNVNSSEPVTIATLPSFIRPLSNIFIHGGAMGALTGNDIVYESLACSIDTEGNIKLPAFSNQDTFISFQLNMTICIADTQRWNALDPTINQ